MQDGRIRLIDFDAARIFKPEQYGGRQTDERSDIFSLGDSIEIMRDVYGHEKNIAPTETPNHRRCKYEKILVTLAGKSVVGLVSYADEIQTERGLHQGSTLDEVLAAYGRRAIGYEDNGLTLYEYLFVSAQKIWLSCVLP